MWERGRKRPLVRAMKILSRANLKLKIGLAILILLVLITVIGPAIYSFILKDIDPTSAGSFRPYLPPSFEHPLGTDLYGRDWLALIIKGLGYSLIIGAMAGGLATLIAVTLALVAGYKGGICDTIVRSITDTWLVIPSWPILVVATVYIKIIDIYTMSLILAIFSWAWTARTIRAQILSLKEMPYVSLAKISGLSDLEIIYKEILPNLIPYVIVGFAYAVVGAILAETGLRLIGLGPTTLETLGFLIGFSMEWGALSLGMWHIVVPPILVLTLIFIALNLINMGLEEEFNPRLKKITGL